jgi:hypothetical protein
MNLEQLVAEAQRYGSYGWDGDAWRSCESHLPYEIARQAGLGPPPARLLSREASLATKVLAHVCSGSLPHGRKRYRASVPGECRELIKELGVNARFHSNSGFEGRFEGDGEPRTWCFTPLKGFENDIEVIRSSADGRSGRLYG